MFHGWWRILDAFRGDIEVLEFLCKIMGFYEEANNNLMCEKKQKYALEGKFCS